MLTRPYDAWVYRDREDGFAAVEGTAVLINSPHGFGDFVFFAYVLPLLEPSNRYFITRFGDHNTALMDGCPHITPLYMGYNRIDDKDGEALGYRHFGLREPCVQADGRMTLHFPLALHHACHQHGIETVLDVVFHEPIGRTPFPFHSKARYLARQVVKRERLREREFARPLPSSLVFEAPAWVQTWVEARLRSLTGWKGRKLCLIGRTGYTSPGKHWGHRWREELPNGRRREGEECRDFLRLMNAHNPEWLFLSIEDQLFQGEHTLRDRAVGCVSYAELFGDTGSCGIPFGLVMKALTNIAELAIGVPAGPYHLAMAKPGLPVIGLWTEHVPSWYDEPKAESLHLFSRNLLESGALDRPGSFTQRAGLSYRAHQLQTRIIPGEAVFAAVDELLGLGVGGRPLPRFAEQHAAPALNGCLREQPGACRLIAATIGVGEKYELLARLAAESCREKTGLETFVLGEEEMRYHTLARPQFLKFKLFEEFPGADAILYFDADTMFLREYDALPFADCRSVVAVRTEVDTSWIVQDAALAGVVPPEYFNCGFFIVNRKHHAEMLAVAAQLADKMETPLDAQEPLNAARERLGIPVHWLTWEFNCISFDGQRESERVVLAHFHEIAKRSLPEIERTYKFWKRWAGDGALLRT